MAEAEDATRVGGIVRSARRRLAGPADGGRQPVTGEDPAEAVEVRVANGPERGPEPGTVYPSRRTRTGKSRWRGDAVGRSIRGRSRGALCATRFVVSRDARLA